jgi:hypothetical protein
VNFGIAEGPADGQTIDELLLAAALATWQNKTARRQPRLADEPPLMLPLAQKPATESLALSL